MPPPYDPDDPDDDEDDLLDDPSFLTELSKSPPTATVLLARWRAHHQPVAASTGHAEMTFAALGASGTGTVTQRPPPGELTLDGLAPTVKVSIPEVVIGVALVETGERTHEGDVIIAVTPAWMSVLRELALDPNALNRLDWRQMEELVAGGYRKAGWNVTLTPRSNDGGRDVIAQRDDVGAIRLLDQVKHHAPGHVVPANDVRALYGVLANDPKGIEGRHHDNVDVRARRLH